jgi:uncharacterized protein (TIGR02246 family)
MTAFPSEREEALKRIKHLKSEYFRAIDAKDWDAFVRLFTADCEFITYRDVANTEPKRRTGPQEIAASVRKTTAKAHTRHRADLSAIRFQTPNEAEAEWDMTDEADISGDGGTTKFSGAGRYYERYRLVEGEWFISRLELKRSWIRMA